MNLKSLINLNLITEKWLYCTKSKIVKWVLKMKQFLYSPIDTFDTNPDTDTDRVEVRRIKMLSKVKNKGTIISRVHSLWSIVHMHAWVKVFRIIPEFRILRLTFHRKSASKCWIRQILIASLIYFSSSLGNWTWNC